MDKTWNKDGLTREKQAELLQINNPFSVLESNFSNLLAHALHAAGFIHYYDSVEGPDGHFADIYRYQPIVILNEIKQLDTDMYEQKFIALNTASSIQKNKGKMELQSQLQSQTEDWHARLNHRFPMYTSSFHSGMKATIQTYMQMQENSKFKTQQLFYFLLRAVRNIQSSYDRYLQELLQSGTTDPSFAVLIAFINNYRDIVNRFNERWQEYPRFYLQQVLQAIPREACPHRSWFLIEKDNNRNGITIPPNTCFITGIQENGQIIRYHTLEEHVVNNMQLSNVTGLVQEKNREKFPACRLKYVTAILRSNLSKSINNRPGLGDKQQPVQPEYSPVGLMVESPMLILREGVRVVTIQFGLTDNSCTEFQQLVKQTGEYTRETDAVHQTPELLQYKILNDAFYLELSTGSGWKQIPGYSLSFNNLTHKLQLVFKLDENFPGTCHCDKDAHGYETAHPALRILINREAWLFPYSWATRMEIDNVSVKVDVSGITSMEIHNESGLIDHSIPFQPFGPIAEKGSWLVFGNYEIASKPVSLIEVLFHWKQLPAGESGFYLRYKGYPEAIDNTSFKIRTEQLNDKKWKIIRSKNPFLFSTRNNAPGEAPSPRRELSEYSTNIFSTDLSIPPVTIDEEAFRYGQTRSGFFRIALEHPDMGFGQTAYRKVFSEVMMKNSFRKKKIAVPEEPFIPALESMEIGYKAREECVFVAGGKKTSLRLYHINPLREGVAVPVDSNRPVLLADGPNDEGNLLFSIRNATGFNLIRLFIEMTPLKREIEKENTPEINWYYHNGSQWIGLTAEAILKDSTDNLLCSGLIEISLPHPVSKDELDENGDFRIAASIFRFMENCSSIESFYLNPVEAKLDIHEMVVLPDNVLSQETSFEKTISGLSGVFQITSGKGGKAKENDEELRIRTTQQISHRNRAVTPTDYEQLILCEFPEVIKVLCLPGVDSKHKNRKAVVSLVVMQREAENGRLPLCEHKLLTEIEKYLSHYTSPFVSVDAITPAYEKVTVKCRLNLAPSQFSGQIIQQTESRINRSIAPWTETKEIPRFGYSFSSADLYNSIREDKTILTLTHLSVLHVTAAGNIFEKQYTLNRHFNSEQESFIVSPSAPWCILVPDEQHLIYTTADSLNVIQPGIGDLRIGGTFIINK